MWPVYVLCLELVCDLICKNVILRALNTMATILRTAFWMHLPLSLYNGLEPNRSRTLTEPMLTHFSNAYVCVTGPQWVLWVYLQGYVSKQPILYYYFLSAKLKVRSSFWAAEQLVDQVMVWWVKQNAIQIKHGDATKQTNRKYLFTTCMKRKGYKHVMGACILKYATNIS